MSMPGLNEARVTVHIDVEKFILVLVIAKCHIRK
jgi:hypothetical protein